MGLYCSKKLSPILRRITAKNNGAFDGWIVFIILEQNEIWFT